MTAQGSLAGGATSKAATAALLKQALAAEFTPTDCERVFGMLDIWSGRGQAVTLPLQRVRGNWHMPDLPSTPWLDPDRFSFMGRLRALAPTLREELLATIDSVPLHQYGTEGGTKPNVPHHPVGWRELILFSSLAKRGERERPGFPRAAAVIPTVLESHRLIGELGFLALEPGTVIREHTDAWNFMVNIHLPLVAPEGCGMRVGAESRQLREGEVVAFDTSFLHEAWNHGASRRMTFYIRTLHPGLTPREMDALVALAGHIDALGLELEAG